LLVSVLIAVLPQSERVANPSDWLAPAFVDQIVDAAQAIGPGEMQLGLTAGSLVLIWAELVGEAES